MDIEIKNVTISDIVIATSGRDKGKPFFVVGMEDMFAMLCDGKSRRIDKPKRKKIKHMRLESKSDCRAAVKIKSGVRVTNSEIRRALAEYQAQARSEEGGM